MVSETYKTWQRLVQSNKAPVVESRNKFGEVVDTRQIDTSNQQQTEQAAKEIGVKK